MNQSHSILITAYYRLLADVRELSGVSLDAPDNLSYEWVLIEGPKLDKQILMYIEGGALPHIPDWLVPLWSKFIIYNDGHVLGFIRQLLLFCYKAEYAPTNEQLKAAQAAFEETDDCIKTWDQFFTEKTPCPIHRTARQTVVSLLRETVKRHKFRDILPSHGPGAVFPQRKPWLKSKFLTLYSSIQAYYPYDQFFCGLHSFWSEIMVDERMGPICEADEIISNLVAVPKDSRGPRLICVHPSESIWIQQGQRLVLEDAITSSPLTRGKINFTDQTVNGNLALSSSVSRVLVTLDLKEASDRLSKVLVRYLFGETVYGYLSCARADKVKLLDGRVIVLNKWAPMGNALTFPVQSLLFWSIVHASILCKYGEDCTDIYVFGDDILYPSCYHDGVLEGLIVSGLVPNATKTFVRGFFRESCGVDAYNGIDVTPLRVKSHSVISTQDAVSLLDLAKRLRIKGYMHCSAFIYSKISERFGRLPLCNNPEAQGFFEYVDKDLVSLINSGHAKFNFALQRWEVRCLMVRSSVFTAYTCDWYHIQDSLLRLAHMGNKLSDRGTEYSFPYRAKLVYGWAQLYYK